MNLWATWTVFRFEFSRTLTLPRLVIMLFLATFPAALLLLVQILGARVHDGWRGGIIVFILVPEMVVIMGLLLWAAPVIYAEVEGKTWTYLAVSPAGRGAILLGKYLNAVVWTTATSWLSLTLSLIVLFNTPRVLQLAWILAVLCLLASLTYGAVYSLIGVVFLRRAVAAAVAYTIIAEVVIGTIPIVINISQITVQYHLRSLLVKWMEWEGALQDRMSGSNQLFSQAPPFQHVVSLIVFAAAVLAVAVFALRQRELVIADRV